MGQEESFNHAMFEGLSSFSGEAQFEPSLFAFLAQKPALFRDLNVKAVRELAQALSLGFRLRFLNKPVTTAKFGVFRQWKEGA